MEKCGHICNRNAANEGLETQPGPGSDRSPSNNQHPVQVVGRYALWVVLPHVHEVIFNRLGRQNKNNMADRFTSEPNWKTLGQWSPNVLDI